jgi:hypothetical protein
MLSTQARATTTWLECSGLEQRAKYRTAEKQTVKVMFDEQASTVKIHDGGVVYAAKSVEISAEKVASSSSAHSFGVNRATSDFYYLQFDPQRAKSAYLRGTCKPLDPRRVATQTIPALQRKISRQAKA